MFILDQDKPFVVMPVCYHPTTVLAVDDERDFLEALETHVSGHVPLLCFDSSDAAIEYVKNSRELKVPFAARLHFTGKDDTKECGLSKMLETTVQDFIHPFSQDIDMSFAKPKEESANNKAPEDTPKMHQTFEEFKHSQYVLTETSLYYYNKLSNECDWVSSDSTMIKQLNRLFLNEIEVLTSEELSKITSITHHERPAKLSFSIREVRNELYNRHRIAEIILVSTDYDMPGKNGIEFIKTVAFPGVTLEHALIILTGKNTDEFKQRLNELALPTEYIVKHEQGWVDKLLNLIDQKTSHVFQDCSRTVLRILSEDKNEEACFVFDKHFNDIFTPYLKENNICEMYLYDRQGSYLLLNDNADASWFIIRSEKGMENSLQKAIEYGAPESVIEALSEKKLVLSLYEDSDFSQLYDKLMKIQLDLAKEKKKKEGDKEEVEPEPEIIIEIDWEKYLHTASVFESKTNRLEALGIKSDNSEPSDVSHKYYYAFIKDFPDHGIDKSRILSYREFLNEATQYQIK